MNLFSKCRARPTPYKYAESISAISTKEKQCRNLRMCLLVRTYVVRYVYEKAVTFITITTFIKPLINC